MRLKNQHRLRIEQQEACLICGRAVSSKVRAKGNVGTRVDNWPPTVIHSQAAIHGYSVANIRKTNTSTTEAVSLTVILYRILLLLLLRIYYWIPCDYIINLNSFTQINNTEALSLYQIDTNIRIAIILVSQSQILSCTGLKSGPQRCFRMNIAK